MLQKRPKSRVEARARLDRALADLLRRCPAAAEFTSAVLDLLAMVEAFGDASPQAARRASKPPTYRRGDGVQGYAIDRGRHGDVLVEKRHGNSKDFRCPQEAYRATAAVLSEAPDGGLPFEEILVAVSGRLGYRPAEYLPRICLRFWLGHGQPSLIRARSRYKPLTPAAFVRQSERAWRDLASKS